MYNVSKATTHGRIILTKKQQLTTKKERNSTGQQMSNALVTEIIILATQRAKPGDTVSVTFELRKVRTSEPYFTRQAIIVALG